MRTMKKVLAILFGALILTCTISCKNQDSSKAKEPYVKKYTNDDFYKNGELDPQIALAAYLDMLEHYGVPYSDFLKENLWITDFSLGDFENVGMAGIFWVNDQEHKYLGHEIYLLPGQMIVEHRHIATEYRLNLRAGRCAMAGFTIILLAMPPQIHLNCLKAKKIL